MHEIGHDLIEMQNMQNIHTLMNYCRDAADAVIQQTFAFLPLPSFWHEKEKNVFFFFF